MNERSPAAERRCPCCGGEVRPEAELCRHCGEWLAYWDRGGKTLLIWVGFCAALYALFVGLPNDERGLDALACTTRPGWWWFTAAVYIGVVSLAWFVIRALFVRRPE